LVVYVSVDVRRVVKYPPESFVSAAPADLIAGDNRLAEYSGFEPYVLVVNGLSFERVDGLAFRADVDGYSDVVRLDSLYGVKGLDHEELIKFPVTKLATLKVSAPSPVTGFPWRHRVNVFRPTTVMKLQLGMPLSADDAELAAKYGLAQSLRVATPEPFNIHSGIEEWREVAVKLTSSGTVARLVVPKGRKLVLAGISAERPASPASAYLTIVRDDVEVMNLDLYCLPSLSYEVPVRVVALNKLEATLDVRAAGTYYVRIAYGIGRLTLRERVAWFPTELTAEERRLAEENDLFDKVRAGVT